MTAQDKYGSSSLFRARINSFVALFFIALIPLFAHAGGLGMAPLVAIIGGVGWLTVTSYKPFRPPVAVICLFAFLLWAAITSLWSPYETDEFLTNPIKLILGVCLFLGVFKSIKAVKRHKPSILLHMFWAVNILACGLIIIDGLSDYSLTFFADPIHVDEDLNRKRSDTEMNIGHSVTILLLFSGIMLTSLIDRLKKGWAWATLYFVLLISVAYMARLEIGIIGALLVFVTVIASRWAPIWTLKLTVFLAIASVLFAPTIQWILPFLPTDALPLSWQHRTAMWEHTASRIWEAPLWGHGFDAVRTFDDTMKLGLFDNWQIVSLHPHNAGLHIWVETGLIGAALASLTLFILGRRVVKIARSSNGFAMASSAFTIAVTIVSAVTYGVWQDWWWASSILAAAMIPLCCAHKLEH